MFAVESLNPLYTPMYAVTKQGAQSVVDNLLSVQLLLYQLIARMIRDSKLTGYASSIPVLLENKNETGSLGDGKVLSSDVVLTSDGIRILLNSWLFRLYRYFGILSSDGMLFSDGSILSHDEHNLGVVLVILSTSQELCGT